MARGAQKRTERDALAEMLDVIAETGEPLQPSRKMVNDRFRQHVYTRPEAGVNVI
jgi:CRISPR/Cas system type I-B associated protein Csh2 (Cas7 group RAMP superfamily)